MYFVSIDVRAQVAIILLACGPCVVIVNLLGQVCTLGRAPRTKETLPDFRERCWVTRHSRIFRWLTGCQRTPGFWGVTTILIKNQPKTTPNSTTTNTNTFNPKVGVFNNSNSRKGVRV